MRALVNQCPQKGSLQEGYFIHLAALILDMAPTPPARDKREDRIDVRIDERTRAAFEAVKEIYGFKTDADAIRGIIAILYNRERTMAEIEGRLIGMLVPILETRLKEYYSTEEYKALVRALMDDILNEECDGNE